MAERKVFGRIKFEVNGIKYRFELKKDGLWVRELHHRTVWQVKPEYILRLTQPQTELFVIKPINEEVEPSDTVKPVPNLQEGHLVPGQPASGNVHEGEGREGSAA